MHKRARVKNGKVVKLYYGPEDDRSVGVIVDWRKPTEYPVIFYTTNTNEPVSTVVGDEVHESWTYILHTVSAVKDILYSKHAKERHINQLGSFDVDGITVTLHDRDDYKNIVNLDVSGDDPYKVKNNVWIESEAGRTLLKAKANTFVKTAFIIERDDNSTVNALTTHDELKDYYTNKYGAF